MTRFRLLAAAFAGLAYGCVRLGLPDPLLGFVVGAATTYASAIFFTWGVSRRLRILAEWEESAARDAERAQHPAQQAPRRRPKARR
jgi:hypothetical protein